MAFNKDASIPSLTAAGDVLAKIARTVTGVSAWVDAGDFRELIVQLHSDAGTGTAPTLDVRLQTSYDGTDANAVDIPTGSFTQVVAAASNQIKGLTAAHRYVKVIYTVGGTATPTFNFGLYVSAKR